MSSSLLYHRDREVKINDIVGSGIFGVLYKWVNYGRGWRSRWFVLQDGVLSYYKIHGSGKIVLDQERDGSFKVIGEESKRHIARDRSRPKSSSRKPIGEIHLKKQVIPLMTMINMMLQKKKQMMAMIYSLTLKNFFHQVLLEVKHLSFRDLHLTQMVNFFNEPLSSLQKCFEEFEYSYLLDQAYQWGKMDNNLMRILNVAAFAVSAYAGTEGRSCKPFNPLLGETYEADYPDKGLRFISEKVGHHPMGMACHCDGQSWRFWGDSNLKSKFWGHSIQIDPIGILTLEFEDGEFFQWSKVTTSIYNLILGKIYCDHYGRMCIEGNRGYSCKIKFKEQPLIDRNPHQVNGIVQDKNGKTVATLFGKWNEILHYVMGENNEKGKGSGLSPEPQLIWKQSKTSKRQTKYNLTNFAITLNELTPGVKERLPPTDSRLRPDQRCLEKGEYDKANLEKLRLEQRQRQGRTLQESGWTPRWFAKENGNNTYRYVGSYWEARKKMNWESCPDIFGTSCRSKFKLIQPRPLNRREPKIQLLQQHQVIFCLSSVHSLLLSTIQFYFPSSLNSFIYALTSDYHLILFTKLGKKIK